jgi:hypothetical protein
MQTTILPDVNVLVFAHREEETAYPLFAAALEQILAEQFGGSGA